MLGLCFSFILRSMQPPLRLRHRFNVDPEFRRRFVFAVLGIFSLVGWGGLLLCSDVLTVREITIEGGGSITNAEAKAGVFHVLDTRAEWRPWSPRHRWFVNKEALERALQVRWFTEDVRVERTVGSNILRLKIKEQPMGLVVRTGEQYLEVDGNGIVRRELTNEERVRIAQRMTGRQLATMPMIVELSFIEEPLTVGYKITPAIEEIRKWITIGSLLHRRGLSFRYLTPTNALLTSLTLYNERGIAVYLDTSVSLESQINALASYSNAIKDHQKGIEPAQTFIDVRIPGRIYAR